MLLVWDTETDGFPILSLPHDHPSQVHLVELACVLYERDGTERASVDLIIRPDGWTIPEGASKVHGITNEVAERCGVDVLHALRCFSHLLELADEAAAFNVQFDRNVMSIELLRQGESRPVEWPDIPLTCVMDMSQPVLNLPPTQKMLRAGRNHAKRPNLRETYQILFGEPLVNAHNALVDARACARVYFHLMSRENTT